MLRRLARAAGTICGLIDSYGDRLARIWFHQAALDAIASQPVPYMLTALADAELRQLTQAALKLRA